MSSKIGAHLLLGPRVAVRFINDGIYITGPKNPAAGCPFVKNRASPCPVYLPKHPDRRRFQLVLLELVLEWRGARRFLRFLVHTSWH